jgi:hypothetical protein
MNRELYQTAADPPSNLLWEISDQAGIEKHTEIDSLTIPINLRILQAYLHAFCACH